MAALVIQSLSAVNGGIRALLLVLLILAVLLIVAGAVIALWTFANARKERDSLVDGKTSGEQR